MLAEEETTHLDVELVWVTWLNALERWERNVVLRHELEWHDLWASGEWSWDDLRLEIDRELQVAGM